MRWISAGNCSFFELVSVAAFLVGITVSASSINGDDGLSRDQMIAAADALLKEQHQIPADAVLSHDKNDHYYLRSAERANQTWIIKVVYDTGKKGRFISVELRAADGKPVRVWIDKPGA